MPKRSAIHLTISLSLLVFLFLVLPGIFLYRLSHKILITPTHRESAFSPQALKRFKQKHLILEGDNLINKISYSQEELLAGHFEKIYEEGKFTAMEPDMEVHASGVTISATIYLFSIPVPRSLDTILSRWFPVKNNRIALYTRITAENKVFIENRKMIYRPQQIILGKKGIPSELMFLGRKFLPRIFTRGLPGYIGRVVLKEQEMIVYKPSSPRDDL